MPRRLGCNWCSRWPKVPLCLHQTKFQHKRIFTSATKDWPALAAKQTTHYSLLWKHTACKCPHQLKTLSPTELAELQIRWVHTHQGGKQTWQLQVCQRHASTACLCQQTRTSHGLILEWAAVRRNLTSKCQHHNCDRQGGLWMLTAVRAQRQYHGTAMCTHRKLQVALWLCRLSQL